MSAVKLLSGRLVDSSSSEWKAECLDIHGAALAIRRMPRESQTHAYETLARNKGDEYAARVRRANSLTRGLLDANGMAYGQIKGRE